ncbi:MAG: creatininase family protein [Betaproteobacteria bacterium]|nr:creatininase family protein [Betaproteobacteria bacterium]
MPRKTTGWRFAAGIVLFGTLALAEAAPSQSVYLEELTTAEVREAIRAGKTTIIIPVGATEQNGPHMTLGKHNVRVRVLAGKIAETLGDTLVAPVVAYVPEGAVSPPTGHMKFAGTVSIADAVFSGLLEGAARSFRQHGFTHIVLIGDHGGYQSQLKAVAEKVSREWVKSSARVLYIGEYYRASQQPFVQSLKAKGISDGQIGQHAGAADTSLMLAVDATQVRPERFADAAHGGASVGVSGDPQPATAALGQAGVDLIVAQTAQAIRRARERLQ